jgi:hypothetical protein
VNLESGVSMYYGFPISHQVNGENVAVSAKDMSPFQMEAGFSMLDYKGCRLRRRDLQ